MNVLTKTSIPYEQFDHDIILKVTAAIYNRNLADLKCGTSLPQSNNQAVLGVLLFGCIVVCTVGSTNMGDLDHCDLHGGY